jgi:hypothetical protein
VLIAKRSGMTQKKEPESKRSLHPVLRAAENAVTLKIRFPFPLGKGLGVRFFGTPLRYTASLHSDPLGAILLASLRASRATVES